MGVIMTCVVGIANGKNVFMGADTCGSNGIFRGEVRHPKVFIKDVPVENAKNESMVIGGCGSFRLLQLLEYAFTPPRIGTGRELMSYLTVDFVDAIRSLMKDKGYLHIENNIEKISVDGTNFLLGFRGSLYLVEDAFQAVGWKIQEDAVGSGRDFALGSLHTTRNIKTWTPEKRVQSALQAAATINPFVAGPFNIVHI
jgi:hypothetical protein